MLKAIIIDDEELSTAHLNNLLNDIEDIEVIGVFHSSREGLEGIRKLKPDLIFLDIHMPGMTGIDLAKKVVGKIDSKIIFITAHEQYALKAFEIGVFDYVLKPFSEERITQLMDRLKVNYSVISEDDTYAICAFKYFHFMINDKEVKNIKWRTAKAKELFIYLVQNQNEIVRKDVLIELLWPDSDADKAYDNLYTTIYHVRNTLRESKLM